MELSPPSLEAPGPRIVLPLLLPRGSRRAALEHPECEEAGKGGEAEHQRGLLTGKIRRRPEEVVDGLVAQILGELLDAVRRIAHEAGELRRVLIETFRSGTRGIGHMVDHVGAGRDLHIEETLGLLGRIGCKRRRRLLRLIRGLTRGVGDFGRGLAGFGAHILRRRWVGRTG
jgi:hypothetical protein